MALSLENVCFKQSDFPKVLCYTTMGLFGQDVYMALAVVVTATRGGLESIQADQYPLRNIEPRAQLQFYRSIVPTEYFHSQLGDNSSVQSLSIR